MSLIIEIRAGEGGSDSKDLIELQFGIYCKYAKRNKINIILLSKLPSIITFRAEGNQADRFFSKEAGILKWQRVPPTEKRGRVHTSTITVAVLPEPQEFQIPTFTKDEIEIKTARGSGPGGQHRNVTDSAVQIKHLATGIIVRCEGERSQTQNKAEAIRILAAKLLAKEKESAYLFRANQRKEQVGVGGRGEEKIRTIRIQEGLVYNHINEKTLSYKDYVRGKLEEMS